MVIRWNILQREKSTKKLQAKKTRHLPRAAVSLLSIALVRVINNEHHECRSIASGSGNKMPCLFVVRKAAEYSATFVVLSSGGLGGLGTMFHFVRQCLYIDDATALVSVVVGQWNFLSPDDDVRIYRRDAECVHAFMKVRRNKNSAVPSVNVLKLFNVPSNFVFTTFLRVYFYFSHISVAVD
jgi:hypothetical protein